MIIQLTADGLCKVAAMLDQFATLEATTGIRVDGGYNGHALVSVVDQQTGNDVELRVGRRPAVPADEPGADPVPAFYVLEFEVP